MRQALALAAEAAAEGEVPVGAVVVQNGVVIGRGRNRRETARNALAHAELEAIDEACRTLHGWRLFGCDLYVTLEPCPMCTGAIIYARLDHVYFGAYDPVFSRSFVKRRQKAPLEPGCLFGYAIGIRQRTRDFPHPLRSTGEDGIP